MIVARDHEHTSVTGHAIRVAVPLHVAGAIEARTLAVPEREDAFDLALGIGYDALASERGGLGGSSLIAGMKRTRRASSGRIAFPIAKSTPPSGEPRWPVTNPAVSRPCAQSRRACIRTRRIWAQAPKIRLRPRITISGSSR
ncbi:MAG: hypothetical protein IT520_16255 [Burkholderiales bacterium]|nr:hypothetical protein [Burkholderiales bacterium]